MGGALSEIIAKLGFELDDSALNKGEKAASGFVSKLGGLGGMVAGAFAGLGIASFVSSMTQAGAESDDLAKQIGIGSDALRRWKYAAKLSGVDTAELSTGLRQVAKHAFEASEKGGDSAKAFKDLGVEFKNQDGTLRDQGEIMRDVGAAIADIKSPTERAARAQALFGRSGGRLNLLFADGSEALDKLLKEVDEFAPSAEGFTKSAAEMDDNLDRLNYATNSLKQRLFATFAPTLSRAVEWIARAIGKFSKWTDSTHLMQAAVVIFGGTALAALAPVAYAALAAIVPFAALALVLEDLATFFAGGDSVIGRGLDKIFGAGSANSAQKAVNDLWTALTSKDWGKAINIGEDIGRSIANALDIAGTFLLNRLVDLLNKIPGVHIGYVKTGDELRAERAEQRKAQGLQKGQKLEASTYDASNDAAFGISVGGHTREDIARVRAANAQREVMAQLANVNAIVAAANAGGAGSVPAPTAGGKEVSATVTQTNHIPITINEADKGTATADAAGAAVSGATRRDLDHAHEALVQKVAR